MGKMRSKILSQKITVVILCMAMATVSTGSICRVKASEAETKPKIELLPQGESVEDEAGNVWAKAYEVFYTLHDIITDGIEKALYLFSEESGMKIPMQALQSDETQILVAHATISQNGCYKIVNDMSAEDNKADVIVQRIDQVPPGISYELEPKVWTEASIQLQVSANDLECGMHAQAYSFDGGQTFGDNNCYRTKKEETVLVAVRDKLGNTAFQEVVLKKEPIVMIDDTDEDKETDVQKERTEQENDNGQDVSDEDVLEPPAEKQVILENDMVALAGRGQAEEPTQAVEGDIVPGQPEDKNTSVIEKETISVKEEEVDSMPSKEIRPAVRNRPKTFWKRPVVQKAVQIGATSVSILLMLCMLLFVYRKMKTVHLILLQEGEGETVIGELRLFVKEGKHVLCIPEEFLLAKEQTHYLLRMNVLTSLLYKGQPLYISYMGKTAELKIAPQMPFIV